MSTENGTCPYCDEENSYQNRNCTKCGEQLPWAAWQEAERGAPTPIGAAPVDPSQLHGWEAQNPVGISLSGAPFVRLMTIIAALLVTMALGFVAYNAAKNQNNPTGAATNANTVKEGYGRYGRYGNQLDRQMKEQ